MLSGRWSAGVWLPLALASHYIPAPLTTPTVQVPFFSKSYFWITYTFLVNYLSTKDSKGVLAAYLEHKLLRFVFQSLGIYCNDS